MRSKGVDGEGARSLFFPFFLFCDGATPSILESAVMAPSITVELKPTPIPRHTPKGGSDGYFQLAVIAHWSSGWAIMLASWAGELAHYTNEQKIILGSLVNCIEPSRAATYEPSKLTSYGHFVQP